MEPMHVGVILKDSDACTQDMAKFLWATEIEQLAFSPSYMISAQLESPKARDIASAYLKIAGILIAAAAEGMTAESYVQCYGVKTPLVFAGGLPVVGSRSWLHLHDPGQATSPPTAGV